MQPDWLARRYPCVLNLHLLIQIYYIITLISHTKNILLCWSITISNIYRQGQYYHRKISNQFNNSYKKMTEPGQVAAPTENIIPELKEEPNFLAVRYNQQKKQTTSRPSGAYVPPHKLRAIQQKIMEEDPNSVDHQRMMWQLLRKSINGIVNKVNISNIENIVIELFNENILRGKGLLTKALIKAQMASPNFTHVYAALIAVINTKLPEIGNLVANRVMIMFNRSFHRNNKLVCIATTKMIAHLVNQKVLGEFVALQLLMILLMHPTEDSVQIACDFMTQVGQVLSELSPAAASAIFERFKNLLHEGQIGQKAQYSIEKLFAVRKTGFKNHPGVIPQLDLVEAEDQITHNLDFQQQLNGEQKLNFFKEDPNYAQTQQEWEKIKLEILGEDNIINLKQVAHYQQQMEEYNKEEEQGIKDLTEQDLINLRRTIYLAIQSTVNFEECAHKILKMNIAKGYESELIDMILECCMMERIYQDFFGLLAERFCKIDDTYKDYFIQAFVNYYNSMFKLEVNKIRNLAKMYGHLFFTFSIDWKIMEIIVLKQDTTTSAHRMFLKILFRQIVENLGIEKLKKQLENPEMREYYSGLFPIGHPNDLRFAINYWTSIGLGPLTEEMREVLALQEQMIADRKNRQQQARIQQFMKEEQQMLMAQEEQRRRYEEEQRQIQEAEMIKREQRKEKQRKQIEKQKQNEKQRQKERQRERQRQRQKEREREKQRQKQRERLRQREQRQRQRQRQRRKDKQQQQKRRKRKQRKESSSSSKSDSSSSSQSSSDSETPIVTKRKEEREQALKKRAEELKSSSSSSSLEQQEEIQNAQVAQSQSSGISSGSEKEEEKKPNKPPVRKRVESSSSSASSISRQSKSSSSSSVTPVHNRGRQASKERSRRKIEPRRRRPSSSESSRDRYRRRNRSRSPQNRRR